MKFPEKTYPRVLRRAWRHTDPASESPHFCDALGRDTTHQKLATKAGDYWVCSVTGQMVRDVFLTENPEHYDQFWRGNFMPENRALVEVEKNKAAIAPYERHRKTGRLLEVGSGQGLLLRAAVGLGWRATGNEISPFAAAHAAATAACDVSPGPIEAMELEAGVYDVVLCDNVFEHLQKPMAVLAKLARSLRPGGVLDLRTLSAESLSLWAQPHEWSYFARGHTFIPTLVSLRHYFDACGLRPVSLRTRGFRSGVRGKYGKPGVLRRAMDNLIRPVACGLNLGHRVEVVLEKIAS